MPENANAPRLYALDHLRATMMLLGVVIHSAVSYMIFEPDQVWPYRDPVNSVFFDILVGIIHSFRMPVFFLMSGFFAALIYSRRGSNHFINNRIKRILIPFIAGWSLLFPIIFAGFSFATQQLSNEAYTDYINTPIEWLISLWHFWFLYYLIMFYAITVIATQIKPPASIIRMCQQFIGIAMTKVRGVMLLGLISALTLLPISSGSLDSDLRWIPNAGVFLAYGFVYWCGWLLYGQQERFQDIKQHSYRYLLLAFILLPITSYFVQQVTIQKITNSTELNQTTAHLLAALFSGLLMWSSILGITGWFLRCFNQYNMTARYLTDSAYWVYLVHLPIAIWTTAQLTHLDWSVWVKFSLTLTVTLVLSLLSYHYLVRRTVIGYWLNGKRS